MQSLMCIGILHERIRRKAVHCLKLFGDDGGRILRSRDKGELDTITGV